MLRRIKHLANDDQRAQNKRITGTTERSEKKRRSNNIHRWVVPEYKEIDDGVMGWEEWGANNKRPKLFWRTTARLLIIDNRVVVIIKKRKERDRQTFLFLNERRKRWHQLVTRPNGFLYDGQANIHHPTVIRSYIIIRMWGSLNGSHLN